MVRTTTDDDRIDPEDVAFDPHAIAAAWEAVDDVPVHVAVAVTNEFTDATVTAAEGDAVDGDVVFTRDDAPDVLFEEKAVGVCDRDVAEDHAAAYVALPDRDDGKVLALNPAQAFVDDTDDDRDPWDMTPTDDEIAAAFGVDDVDDITDEMVEDAVGDVDVPDKVDVSDYKTAAGAAKKTAEALREHADAMGYNPDAVNLYRPEDAYQGYDAWAVVWEGGPHEWAVALTGGESLTAFAGPGGFGADPEVAGLTSGAGFDVECHFSFDLVFFDR